MDSWDVRLLTGTYSAEGDKVVVELYGKTRDGKSIVMRYSDFKPYFYMIPAAGRDVEGDLRLDNMVLGVEKRKLKVFREEKDCLKVTIKFPWLVPDYRRRYAHASTIFAADIPFHHRFIYDFDLGSCFRVHGKLEEGGLAKKYTTALVVSAKSFEPCDHFKPQLTILSFDIENSIAKETIYTICCVIKSGDKVYKEQITGSEIDILSGFEKVVQKYDPDVMTGYNIEGYDIPHIAKRVAANKIGDLKLGRSFSAARSSGERFWRIDGRVLTDCWINVKKVLRPKQESLNYVAKMLLQDEKIDVDKVNIDQEWKDDPKKVVEYCTKDADLALRILEKINILDRDMDLATVSKLPLDDVTNGRTSTLIDSILIRAADREGIAVPLTKHEQKDKKIEGGYVHAIKAGVYDWVCVLDFKSMYPSVIISNNICFTTLSRDGTIVSPTGEKFFDKNVTAGLLPKILSNLMNERDSIKKKMKQTKDDTERRYYDGLQNAVKVLMNAFYGVFASSFYRFTNPLIGASITAFARENTKGIIAKLESEGINVVYSDTDSIFFESPNKSLEGAVEAGKSVSERFSRVGVVLEFEKVFEKLCSHGKKKRYFGSVVWPKTELFVRGYEVRRTDSFDLQNESLETLFADVLSGRTDDAVKNAKSIIFDVKSGKIQIEKLVISKTVQDESAYKDPDSLVNVTAARKMKEQGFEFTPGMKVAFIVTDSKKNHMDVEPYISGKKFEHMPDWDYYAKRLAQSLGRITEIFGYDEDALLSGIRVNQSSLLAGGWENEPAKSNKKGEKRGGEGGDSDDISDSGVSNDDETTSAEGAEETIDKSKKNGPNITKKSVTLQDFL